MNRLLNQLEKRFGKYAVPDLIKYVIALYCAGAALGLVNQGIYYNYLSLNMEAVFHGQVWRLFTYLVEPYGIRQGLGFIVDIIFFAIQVNLFFLFGRTLENAWGTFRFNMYFLSGWLFNILAALILYLSPLHSTYYGAGFQYIYMSMFLAFATINPDMELLLYFILPIKIKWLAILEAAILAYDVISNGVRGIQALAQGMPGYAGVYFGTSAAILVALANFLLYYFSGGNVRRRMGRAKVTAGDIRRRKKFRNKMTVIPGGQGGTRHRCAICGRTEADNEALEFRYCSKCEGNYEYCMDHLFTHEHVKREQSQ